MNTQLGAMDLLDSSHQIDSDFENFLDEIHSHERAEWLEERMKELHADSLRGSPLDDLCTELGEF
jgi:hypothetical protein